VRPASKEVLSPIDGYLLDLDGTVYRGDRAILGAAETIATLRSRGRRLVFLTNKPLHSREAYAEKLSGLGIPAAEDDIVTSSYVLARRLADRAPQARVFAIGEPPLLLELEHAGMVLSENPQEVDVVVAAFDRTFDYHKLDIAFQAIKRGAWFVATNPDRSCPVDGGEIPDAAGVIAALEATTGRTVDEVVGKPSPLIVAAALDRVGLPAQRCAIVGDRLETDMAMGLAAGLTTIVTLTGITTRDALAGSPYAPAFVIDSLADLAALDARCARSAAA
jgi:HAD superfamily hydrolase (TIGR01457 family)